MTAIGEQHPSPRAQGSTPLARPRLTSAVPCARRHRVVQTERRELRRHPAGARAQPAARLCQRRVSARLLERAALAAAAAGRRAAFGTRTNRRRRRRRPGRRRRFTRRARAPRRHALAAAPSPPLPHHPPLPCRAQDAGRASAAAPRRLWPDLGVDAVGRAHGGARAPLCAAHRRRAPARLRLLARVARPAAAAAAGVTDASGAGSLRAARAPRRPRDLRGPTPHRRGAVRL